MKAKDFLSTMRAKLDAYENDMDGSLESDSLTFPEQLATLLDWKTLDQMEAMTDAEYTEYHKRFQLFASDITNACQYTPYEDLA